MSLHASWDQLGGPIPCFFICLHPCCTGRLHMTLLATSTSKLKSAIFGFYMTLQWEDIHLKWPWSILRVAGCRHLRYRRHLHRYDSLVVSTLVFAISHTWQEDQDAIIEYWVAQSASTERVHVFHSALTTSSHNKRWPIHKRAQPITILKGFSSIHVSSTDLDSKTTLNVCPCTNKLSELLYRHDFCLRLHSCLKKHSDSRPRYYLYLHDSECHWQEMRP